LQEAFARNLSLAKVKADSLITRVPIDAARMRVKSLYGFEYKPVDSLIGRTCKAWPHAKLGQDRSCHVLYYLSTEATRIASSAEKRKGSEKACCIL
jgi:hypothetical protein